MRVIKLCFWLIFFFFQAEDGIRDLTVTGVQTCALPIFLSQIIDPHLYPEISAIRQQVLSWRFYHHFRTDLDSPVRQPQIGVYTPVLSHDGSDLAAALQTILEIGDGAALRQTVAEAFGGASLLIEAMDTLFSIKMKIPGLLRLLQAQEFSGGQVRSLCLCAAVLRPRPASLLA